MRAVSKADYNKGGNIPSYEVLKVVTDGGEFGLGCEIGISTQKLQDRVPMGLEEIFPYKYVIRGDGQTR